MGVNLVAHALRVMSRPSKAYASCINGIHARHPHRQKRLHEIYIPYLVNSASLYGTSQLPKFAGDLFHTLGLVNDDGEQQSGFSLIPTAEVPLTNSARDEIYDEAICQFV